VIAWLVAFVLTCAIELAVVYWLGPLQRRPSAQGGLALRTRLDQLASVALAAQLATHPFVWIAMATLPGSQIVRLAVVELWATLVETAIYKRWLGLPGRDAFALSALANAASLLVVAALALLV
jgi:hypothetical protein